MLHGLHSLHYTDTPQTRKIPSVTLVYPLDKYSVLCELGLYTRLRDHNSWWYMGSNSCCWCTLCHKHNRYQLCNQLKYKHEIGLLFYTIIYNLKINLTFITLDLRISCPPIWTITDWSVVDCSTFSCRVAWFWYLTWILAVLVGTYFWTWTFRVCCTFWWSQWHCNMMLQCLVNIKNYYRSIRQFFFYWFANFKYKN